MEVYAQLFGLWKEISEWDIDTERMRWIDGENERARERKRERPLRDIAIKEL